MNWRREVWCKDLLTNFCLFLFFLPAFLIFLYVANFSLPGPSVHGILQARILEWVAIPFSRGSSQPRDWVRLNLSLLQCRRILYHPSHQGSPND